MKLSADDIAFSAENLGRQRGGDQDNSETVRCLPL
jgi:hypothetical protein